MKNLTLSGRAGLRSREQRGNAGARPHLVRGRFKRRQRISSQVGGALGGDVGRGADCHPRGRRAEQAGGVFSEDHGAFNRLELQHRLRHGRPVGVLHRVGAATVERDLVERRLRASEPDALLRVDVGRDGRRERDVRLREVHDLEGRHHLRGAAERLRRELLDALHFAGVGRQRGGGQDQGDRGDNKQCTGPHVPSGGHG